MMAVSRSLEKVQAHPNGKYRIIKALEIHSRIASSEIFIYGGSLHVTYYAIGEEKVRKGLERDLEEWSQ